MFLILFYLVTYILRAYVFFIIVIIVILLLLLLITFDFISSIWLAEDNVHRNWP